MLTMGKTVSSSSCAWDLAKQSASINPLVLVFAQSCIPCLQAAHDPQGLSLTLMMRSIHDISNTAMACRWCMQQHAAVASLRGMDPSCR